MRTVDNVISIKFIICHYDIINICQKMALNNCHSDRLMNIHCTTTQLHGWYIRTRLLTFFCYTEYIIRFFLNMQSVSLDSKVYDSKENSFLLNP